jgi:hypothetical protein
MTLMTAKAEVLKQDARGRLRMPLARREALLDEFEKSGVSAAKFARLVGINYATFAGWAQQRRKDRASISTTKAAAPLPETGKPAATVTSAAPLRLLEAVIEQEPPCKEERKPFAAAGLVVELPGGCRMRIDSPVQLQMAAEFVALVARSLRSSC